MNLYFFKKNQDLNGVTFAQQLLVLVHASLQDITQNLFQFLVNKFLFKTKRGSQWQPHCHYFSCVMFMLPCLERNCHKEGPSLPRLAHVGLSLSISGLYQVNSSSDIYLQDNSALFRGLMCFAVTQTIISRFLFL